jgi:glutaredoxin 2
MAPECRVAVALIVRPHCPFCAKARTIEGFSEISERIAMANRRAEWSSERPEMS